MIYFAEASNSFSPPVEIAAWLACLAFIIALINGGLKLVDRMTGKKKQLEQPVQIEHTEPCAKKSDLERHIAATDKNFAQVRDAMDKDRHDNQVHASARAAGLYKKIDEVRCELDEKFETVRSEVNETPDRTVALLRNTGVIK